MARRIYRVCRFLAGYVCVAANLPNGLPILSEQKLRGKLPTGVEFESFGRLVDRLMDISGRGRLVHGDSWRIQIIS